jgi:hypothetical protein
VCFPIAQKYYRLYSRTEEPEIVLKAIMQELEERELLKPYDRMGKKNKKISKIEIGTTKEPLLKNETQDE